MPLILVSGKHTCASISYPTVPLQRPAREDQKGDFIFWDGQPRMVLSAQSWAAMSWRY